MTTGPDGERRPEPTFADVMNGFGLDSGRPVRRRLFGRRREGGTADAGAARRGATGSPAAPPPAPAAGRTTATATRPRGDAGGRSADAGPDVYDGAGSRRGRPAVHLDAGPDQVRVRPRDRDAGVHQPARAGRRWRPLQVEHRAVAELCEQTRSVAEVAALLSLPLGVARVVLGDMAGLGVVTVHQTASSAGSAPDLALMERVLSGLRRL